MKLFKKLFKKKRRKKPGNDAAMKAVFMQISGVPKEKTAHKKT